MAARRLQHVIAYRRVGQRRAAARRLPGTLDDYAMTVHACIDGWIASGEMRFYHAAVKLADAMIAQFYDRTAGAFFDTAAPADGSMPLGALTARRKPLQDSPTPAGNPTAAVGVAASGRIERAQGVSRDRRGYARILRRHRGALRAVCGQLWAGTGAVAASIQCRWSLWAPGRKRTGLRLSRWRALRVNKTVIRLSAGKAGCRRASGSAG